MPACRDCPELRKGRCAAFERAKETLGRPLPPPPLGACFFPIVEGYLEHVREGTRVLEIGCGTWSRLRDHAAAVGARFEGIDSEASYYGRPVVARRVENLRDLSFSDESFDVVAGSQTMEHWRENGCPLEFGLFQCFRVCRTGGRVLLNVPIHFHGSTEFMLGRRDRIRDLFAPFSRTVTFEEWGRPSDPLPPCLPYPRYRALRDRPAYQLDIRAVKDRPLPPAPRRRRCAGGLLGKVLSKPPGFLTSLSFSIFRGRGPSSRGATGRASRP
ncbi:MAG: methyltransferase domain-containing protein [Candidatus Latescibacteria bacterium]|nr:methyltransferase domain-containing protein [Candidatus Latescibacterota bacterium]